jgi:hypothetical protein
VFVAQQVAWHLVAYMRCAGDQRQYSHILWLQDRTAAPSGRLIAGLEPSWNKLDRWMI